jgi:predicted secreted protein
MRIEISMYKNNLRAVVTFLAVSAWLSQDVDAAMTTAGKFAVINSGAATFSVEIQVPPGTGGIVPKLSIDYTSDGGNALVGLGGSIGGLSSITRCARTKAQDGTIGGINFDGYDRFCLDGQRLIAVKGADGADGTEYRTEINVYARIKSHGTAGIGPAWFSVETKAGDILEYGNTSDSRIEAQGRPTAAVWALNKRRDVNSNYLTISYNEDTVNGAYWPATISYTGNASKSIAPYNFVKFNYISRKDVATSYTAGSLRKETVVLQSIDTYAGSAIVKNYKIEYNYIAPTQRPLMRSIQECAGNGNCLPSITMQTAPPASNTFSGEVSMVNGLALDASDWDIDTILHGTVVTDINGDGLLDIVRMTCNEDNWATALCTGTITRKIFINNGRNFVLDTAYTNSLAGSDIFFTRAWHDMGTRMVDVNGDGLPDIIQIFQRNLRQAPVKRILLNTGSGFVLDSAYTASLADVDFYLAGEGESDTGGRDGEYTSTQIVDMNGDGLLDLVYISGRVFINTGSRFAYDYNYSTSLARVQTVTGGGGQFADINGDGLLDVIVMATSNFYNVRMKDQKFFRGVALNTGTALVMDTDYTNSINNIDAFFTGDWGDLGTRLIDVNGDGLPDLVQMYTPDYGQYNNQPQRRAYLNTGRAFVYNDTISRGLPDVSFAICAAPQQDSVNITDLGLRLSDINGDGLVDLISAPADGKMAVWLNTGAGFAANATLNASLPSLGFSYNWVQHMGGYSTPGLRFPDINGDGLPDLVVLGALPTVFLNQHSAVPNRLTSFVQLGDTTSVTYGPLTDKSVYSKDSGAYRAVFPNLDEQYSKYVAISATVPNGAGGGLTSTYTYGGLKTEQGGRGGLGFRWIESDQKATGIVTRTEFNQAWPYVGMETSVVETLPGSGNGGVLRSRTTTPECIDHITGGGCVVRPLGIYLPYTRKVVESNWDLNGAALPVTTTTQSFDRWGNTTNVISMTNGGYSKTTVNTYLNDETNWFIGRVTNSTVTVTIP